MRVKGSTGNNSNVDLNDSIKLHILKPTVHFVHSYPRLFKIPSVGTLRSYIYVLHLYRLYMKRMNKSK